MSMNNNTSLMATENVSKVGLGYGIAIAVGILVLVSTIMLASYVCVRVQGVRGTFGNTNNGEHSHSAGNINNNNSLSGIGSSVNIIINCIEGGTGGLDESTIDSYPKVVYYRRQQLPRSQDTCCSICLGEYKYKEVLRLLPDCKHCFHAGCVDAWLRLNPSCPVCRTASPLPSPSVTPLPTPLSELIPLARHSVDGR
ncbi:hypothetical protein SUGI_0199920 [Cryptomeria japonica]|nr:hypothetical protein SUGI_0199920 [Cryptomeria japonica]